MAKVELVPLTVSKLVERSLVAKKLVVVALVNSELPVRVVEASTAERLAFNCPPTLSSDAIVVEPVTASVPVEVALEKVAPPLKVCSCE